MKTTMLCLLNTLLMVTGQVLFKIGASGKIISSFKDIVILLFNPIIIFALFIYGGTTMLWLYILNKTPISYAYPIQALAFPAVLVISSILFKEAIPITRWIGVCIIFIGVFVAVK